MKNQKLTEAVGAWLQTPEQERDYTVGALYLLKLSGNQVQYSQNIAALKTPLRRQLIEHQLQKYYNFRVADLTRAQVEHMQSEVDGIASSLNLEEPASEVDEQRNLGKRADHDSLPDDIIALYKENLVILHKMRELHLQLRKLSLTDSPCPDSERYPFLKELIALDKKMHSNWEAYDHYTPEEPAPKKKKGRTSR